MHKPYRLFLPVLLLLAGCYAQKGIVVKEYPFDNDISLTLDKVSEGRNFTEGYTNFYSKKDYKLVFLIISIANHSGVEKDIDLSRMFLLDPSAQKKYKLEKTMAVTVVNVEKPLSFKIKSNEVTRRELIFLFPKNQNAEAFSIGDNIYSIKYL